MGYMGGKESDRTLMTVESGAGAREYSVAEASTSIFPWLHHLSFVLSVEVFFFANFCLLKLTYEK
jgi:hypothetical protein